MNFVQVSRIPCIFVVQFENVKKYGFVFGKDRK